MTTHQESAPSDLLAGFGDLEGLRRLAARLVRDDAEADDVVQDSLLLGMQRVTGGVRNVGAWLRGVVRNKAREARRAAARREARESEATPGRTPMDPIDVAARLEVHDRLVAAVKQLPEPYRSAVWLRYVEDRAAPDIAREVGAPVETVRTRIKRGIAQLREELDRRHAGRRADWVPSLALFAGVEPSLSLLAATTAAGAATAGKSVMAAAAVLLLIGVGVIAGPRLFSTNDEPSIAPSRDTLEASPSGPSERRVGATAAEQRPGRLISAAPFVDQPAFENAGTENTFSFHYGQGFSFDSQTVSGDVASADIVFKSCAGGISSVVLEAPGGVIAGLERFQEKLPTLKHALALARSVVRADAAALVASTTASGDDRTPASDAFVLRTRHGRWVVLAILERGDSPGGWEKYPVTIRYGIADEPVFRKEPGDLTVDGIEIDSRMADRLDRELQENTGYAHDDRLEPFRRLLGELDRRAAAAEPSVQARDGADVRVAAVLDQTFAKPMGSKASYVAATYSFEHATRDAVAATRNDWDFRLKDGRLDVRMVTDDRSSIWDLGPVIFVEARSGRGPSSPSGVSARVALGHVYAVHTVDTGTDQWALMRVDELVSGEWLIFSWVVVRDASALTELVRAAEPTMDAPLARLQLRGGAIGGNPVRARLDGSTQYVEISSEAPLDLEKGLSLSEAHTTYIAGGKVPEGKVFLVERIDYAARVQGDMNGSGEFILQVGLREVARVRETGEADQAAKKFQWVELGREDRVVSADAMPVRGSLAVSIPIAPGAEADVWVGISNSCWADVTLSGRFVAADSSELPR
jgi:RNA polymerase sigma factor (sigma-70 family)